LPVTGQAKLFFAPRANAVVTAVEFGRGPLIIEDHEPEARQREKQFLRKKNCQPRLYELFSKEMSCGCIL
jgi:hypothetical protein